MYGHHVATLGLVSLSYFNGWQPIGTTLAVASCSMLIVVAPEEAAFATESIAMSAGLSTLFLHDSSDIIVDAQLGSQGAQSATLCRVVVLRLKMVNYLSYASWRDTRNRHQPQRIRISRFHLFLFGLSNIFGKLF